VAVDKELRSFLTASKSGLTLNGTLRGAQEAVAKLQALNRSMQKRIIRKGVRKSSQLGAKITKNFVPKKSGTLRNSIGWRLARARQGIPKAAGIVGARRRYVRITARGFQVATKYSHLVDKGTKPHIINARKADRLFFRVGGRSVYVKYVRHPGARASNFMQRGEHASRSPMYHVFTRTVSGELALQAIKARPSEVDDG
jgi:hypothetical protein